MSSGASWLKTAGVKEHGPRGSYPENLTHSNSNTKIFVDPRGAGKKGSLKKDCMHQRSPFHSKKTKNPGRKVLLFLDLMHPLWRIKVLWPMYEEKMSKKLSSSDRQHESQLLVEFSIAFHLPDVGKRTSKRLQRRD